MLEIKVSEATPRQLDWMVAKCEGATDEWHTDKPFLWNGVPCVREAGHDVEYTPSIDWSQGGPIIERERLWVGYSAVGQSLKLLVMADDVVQCHKRAFPPNCSTTGPTILIAAMRCYVASKLGDTIEIPEELTNVRN